MTKNTKSKGYPLHDYYSKIYKRYDLVNRIFTLGLDKKWRTDTALACALEKPNKVIDICCGTGDLALRVKDIIDEKAEVVGYDFNQQMLDVARSKVEKKSYEKVEFRQGDAAEMPFSDGEFDCITIGFGFRNLTYKNPNVGKHLSEMNRVLRKGGKLFILESSVPTSAFLKFFYLLYLRFILIPIGGLISGNWKAYSYLASSSANYFNLEELSDLLGAHNFTVTSVKTYFFGSTNLVIAEKSF